MINFDVIQRRNPKDGTVKFYSQVYTSEYMTLDDIAENISRECTVTVHDIKAVLSALQEQVLFALRDGNSVRLGDLGSFRLTLSGRPCETADEVTADTIEHLRVRFTMSSRLRSRLAVGQQGVRFVRKGDVAESEPEPVEP